MISILLFQVIGKPDKPGPSGLTSDLSPEQAATCMDEAGITEDEMKAVMKDPKEISEKVLCLLKCRSETIGEIGKDGKLDVDFIKVS